ncbi:hypothetical protein ACIBPB_05585 [Micromonospora sp. NPDC049836]|uniref:allene oxide cyclase barrel-like domain-containing protein n=1 Tax=Micromonospora sp. NPDC049836 TaxID=3364274 RepID=UPI0037A7854A
MPETELTDIRAELAKEQEKESDANPISTRALATAAAVAAGRIEPHEVAGADVLAECIVLDGLTEVVEKMVIHAGPDGPGPGTIAEYTDALLDAEGQRVGTITGRAVVLDMLPHMWQLHRNVTEFPDGSMEAVGVVDATSIVQGLTATIPVTGLSGRYAGRTGFRTLVLTEGDDESPRYDVTIVLC